MTATLTEVLVHGCTSIGDATTVADTLFDRFDLRRPTTAQVSGDPTLTYLRWETEAHDGSKFAVVVFLRGTEHEGVRPL